MAFQFDTNSIPATGAVCIYKLRAALVAAGWTSQQDSDGTTYSAAGTQLTGGGAGANGLGNANAWFVLQAPAVSGQRRSICFQRGGSNLVWRFKYSRAAGFVGGAPGPTQVPSATDEAIDLGGGTDAAPTFATLLGADNTLRFNCCAGDATVGYGFWMDAFPTGNAATTHYGMTMEVMAPGSYQSADVDPCVIYFLGAGFGSSSAWSTDWFSSLTNTKGFLNLGGVPTRVGITPPVYYNPATGFYAAPGYSAGFGAGQDLWTTKDPGIPIAYSRNVSQAAPTGFKGFGQLIRWAAVFRSNMDTNSVSAPGAKDWVWINGALLPWDGSTPVI